MNRLKSLKNAVKLLPAGYFAAAVILFAAVFCAAIGFAAAPKQEFSEDENRVLEPFPALSFENIKSGAFMKSFEHYIGDHFALREIFVSGNTLLQLAFGKRDLAASYGGADVDGGVYFGEKGHLYEVLLPDKTGTFRQNVDALARFSKDAQLPVYILPVPSGAQEQAENLPAYAPEYDQKLSVQLMKKEMGRSAKVVDIFQTLSLKSGHDYYFKTDHHWTAEGAYKGYQALVSAMGITPVAADAYALTEAPEPFYGTLYSKALFPLQEPDRFRYPVSKNQKDITQQEGGRVHQGIYWKEYLSQKDKYSFYLGGNQGETVIRNPAVGKDRLLILKDSFANSMVPYLIQNFSEICLIDLRYYNQDINQYIQQNGIDKIAVIYSIEQLSDVPIYNKLP